MSDTNTAKNTDVEIWRRVPDDYYSPSIAVTESGAISVNVAGLVIVLSVEEFHSRAQTQPPSKPEGDKVSDDEEVSIETLTSHVEYTFESEQYKNIVNTPKDNILGFMESCHEVIQSLRKSHSALVEENEELKKELELGDKTIMDALAKYSKEGEKA